VQLGYRANPLARALPTGRTSMIALVIADVTDPFYNEIIRGAERAAADANYTMLLADAQESGTVERAALERALPTVEGVVLATSRNVGLGYSDDGEAAAGDRAEPGGRGCTLCDH
jgi:LacI family repressor for deo operon, udp, cdd, tsx, nupC, and nupG